MRVTREQGGKTVSTLTRWSTLWASEPPWRIQKQQQVGCSWIPHTVLYSLLLPPLIPPHPLPSTTSWLLPVFFDPTPRGSCSRYEICGSPAPCPCSELALTLTPVCPPAWIQQKFGKLRFAFHRAIWVVDRTDLHAITPARFSTSTVPTAMDYARLHLHCTTCFALLCLRWFKDELNL